MIASPGVGSGSSLPSPRSDFGAAFAFGERHVVDSEYRCFIDCIFHVEIGRFVFQLEFRGGEYPELVGLCIGVLDCRPAGAVGTQSEVEFLRFELVVVETGIIVDRFEYCAPKVSCRSCAPSSLILLMIKAGLVRSEERFASCPKAPS